MLLLAYRTFYFSVKDFHAVSTAESAADFAAMEHIHAVCTVLSDWRCRSGGSRFVTILWQNRNKRNNSCFSTLPLSSVDPGSHKVNMVTVLRSNNWYLNKSFSKNKRGFEPFWRVLYVQVSVPRAPSSNDTPLCLEAYYSTTYCRRVFDKRIQTNELQYRNLLGKFLYCSSCVWMRWCLRFNTSKKPL